MIKALFIIESVIITILPLVLVIDNNPTLTILYPFYFVLCFAVIDKIDTKYHILEM